VEVVVRVEKRGAGTSLRSVWLRFRLLNLLRQWREEKREQVARPPKEEEEKSRQDIWLNLGRPRKLREEEGLTLPVFKEVETQSEGWEARV